MIKSQKTKKIKVRINNRTIVYPHIVHGKQVKGKVEQTLKTKSNGYIFHPMKPKQQNDVA